MFDMGSGGPTRYLAHAVEWNNRRRAVARSTVVVASNIPGRIWAESPISEVGWNPASGSGGATEKIDHNMK